MEKGILRVPYSVHAKFSFVDLEEVAEAAKVILTEPGHVNATYELAGTSPLSHVQVAEILGRVLNLNIRAEKEEIRDWRTRVRGMREYAVENLVKMFEYYDEWGLVGNPNVLRWLLKRGPTSFEKFVDRIIREHDAICLLYTSPSPRDRQKSRMPSSA